MVTGIGVCRMSETYVVATPVAPYKKDLLPAYKQGVESLKPQPETVGIVTTQEVFDEYFADNDLYTLVAPHPDLSLPYFIKVARAREILRLWFLNERTEDLIFWIDSDIQVFSYTFTDIHNYMKFRKCLSIANGYESRYDPNIYWYGFGTTLIHRDIVDASRFYAPVVLNENGEVEYFNEDMTYLANLCYPTSIKKIKQIRPDINEVHIEANVTDVIHHIK